MGSASLHLNPSYRYCHSLTRRAAANFYPTFLVLPRCRRRAMEALYAFMRTTDDLADEPGEIAGKIAALRNWRLGLEAALQGEPTHELHAALVDTVRRYGIPHELLFTVIDGVESDLSPVSFAHFDELRGYCYRVASAVGMACIHIWGFRGTSAPKQAEAAGIAFQLTNILRDLAEDRSAGRVYLPTDEIQRFGCPASNWKADCGSFQALMAFQADRARRFYAEGNGLRDHLTAEGRAVFGAMNGTYRGLLDEIVSRQYDVFRERVRLPRTRKAGLLWRAFRTRWGWV